jgi:outer membrane protein OmpA-like peptidoglycan-associated protein
MKIRILKISFPFTVGILILVAGCNKQKSTLSDLSNQKDTTAHAPDFSGVDTSGEASFSEAQLSGELAKKAQEALQPIYFDYNSFELNALAIERLEIVATFLKENAGLRILIQGNCDERGSSEYNMGLGDNRAKAVKNYLLKYGIQPIRLESTSLGKEQPAVPNCKEETCHAKNRRSEFVVLAR